MLFACAGAVVASGAPIAITAARNPVLTSLIIILMPLHPDPNWYSVSSLKGLWIIFRQGNERLDRHSAHAIVRSPVSMPFSGTFTRWAECRRGGRTAR